MNARTIQIAFLTASLVSCPIAVTGQAGKPDLEALDGAWNVVEIEIAGKKVVVGKGSPDKVVIKDGKISILALGKPFAIFENGDMKLDSNKKPKTIDIVLTERGFTVPGIYEMERRGFKLAIPRASATSDKPLERPQSFDTKGNNIMVLVTKRLASP